ncbi:VOC family protein [Camelliibacillus cellulosilyticus]|uniref:VOC family protein n=1 Tax=Camelliibacillus cellulosilyticus TaxID=2174486 RepID=A0ABV9GK57_9BACL
MTKQVWINLPIKDVRRSKAFYQALGFKIGSGHGNGDEMAELLIGEPPVAVMLFPESAFEKFTNCKIADSINRAEVLFSIYADSREEVDEMAKKAVNAGGTVFGEPGESDGWMYGCGFADPDGHRWNMLYMDINKAPKAAITE